MTSALVTCDRVRKAAHSEYVSSVFDCEALSNNKDLEKMFDLGTKDPVLFAYPPLYNVNTDYPPSMETNMVSSATLLSRWITGCTDFQTESCSKGCYLPIWVPRPRAPAGTPLPARTRTRAPTHTGAHAHDAHAHNAGATHVRTRRRGVCGGNGGDRAIWAAWLPLSPTISNTYNHNQRMTPHIPQCLQGSTHQSLIPDLNNPS